MLTRGTVRMRIVGAMLLLLTGLAVAACGSSNSSSSKGSAVTSSGSGGDITIATLGTYSGPAASSLAPGLATLKAEVADLNAAGGIDGRKVHLLVEDDGGTAATALQDARQIVSEKVAAVVGDYSLDDTAWAPLVEKSGIPVIGGSPQNVPFATNPDFFPVGANYVALSYAKLQQTKIFGTKFAGLYCAEAPVCAAITAVYKSLAPSLGLDDVLAQSVLATAPSFTAQCLAIKNSGADSFIDDTGTVTALSIVDQCHNLGVSATPIGAAGVINSTWLGHAGAQNARDIELAFPFFDTTSPAAKAYHAMLVKHHLGQAGGAAGTYTYLALKLFVAAVEAAGKGPVTSSSVLQGLYALHNETLGGLTAPLTFTKGKPTLDNCYFVAAIKGSEFTLPQGLKPSCAPAPVVQQVLKSTGA